MRRHFRYLVPLAIAGFTNISLAEPLSFDRTLELAEQRSATLRASTSAIASARSAAIPAASLPDPRLVAGIDNFPVSGPDAGSLQRDFMTMQKIGVMQEIPNREKRRARAAVAMASVDTATAQWHIDRQVTRRDAAVAWLDLYYLKHQEAQFQDWERENALFADVVAAQLTSGRGVAADSVAPKQEAVQLADRRDDISRDIERSRAALHALLGEEANEPLAGNPPQFPVAPSELRYHLQHHPELLAAAVDTQKAQAELAEARSLKKPDWGVELDYARRGPQFGNMISLQFTVDLPLFQSTRQDPLISARHDALNRKEAERDGMLRDHARDLEEQIAEYTALTRQLDRAERTALPLSDEKIRLLMASYQAGKSELSAVLIARRERIEERLRIGELRRQQAVLAARLHFAYGDDTP